MKPGRKENFIDNILNENSKDIPVRVSDKTKIAAINVLIFQPFSSSN